MNGTAGMLTGHTALITGAESGIGRACALALANAGAAVCIGYKDDGAGAEETRRQATAAGARAVTVRADVGSPHDVERLLAACVKELGTPDLLVHSAGINAHGKRVVDLAPAEWDAVLRTNLTGPFLVARAFLRALPVGTPGRIVIVTSVHEEMPALGVAEYCASKGGLRSLVRCLALEAAARRVTVNAIAPGTIVTAMTQELIDDPAAMAEHEKTIPLGRAGRVDDIAAAAVFLCGDGADYITGTSITVDGGMLLNVASGPPQEG